MSYRNAKVVLSNSEHFWRPHIFPQRNPFPINCLATPSFLLPECSQTVSRTNHRQPRQAVAGSSALVESKEHSFLFKFWNLQVYKSVTISKTCDICLKCYGRCEKISMNRATSCFLYLTKWSYYSVLEIIYWGMLVNQSPLPKSDMKRKQKLATILALIFLFQNYI